MSTDTDSYGSRFRGSDEVITKAGCGWWVVVQFDEEASQARDFVRTRHFARLAQILHCAKGACSG